MEAYAYIMMLVYPVGVPALYAYLLFYHSGIELQLLRELQRRRVAAHAELDTTHKLASARADDAKFRSGQMTKKCTLCQSLGLTNAHTARRASNKNRRSTHGKTELELVKRMKELEEEEETLRSQLPD